KRDWSSDVCSSDLSVWQQFNNQLFSGREKEMILQSERPLRTEDTVTSYINGLEFLIRADYRKKLQQISQPTLLIHGKDDEICPPGATTYIAKNVQARATVKMMDNDGHLPFYNKADKCYAWVKGWINHKPLETIDALEGDC